MKKYLFAMLGALFVFTACTTGKPENDGNKTTEEENDYITMYVASEISSERNPFIGGPSYIVKFAEDGQCLRVFSEQPSIRFAVINASTASVSSATGIALPS